MNIGVIGAGAIANFLLEATKQETNNHLHIKSIYVSDYKKYKSLEEKYHVTLYTDLDAFLQSNIDIVVEAANIDAVKKLIPQILPMKDVVLICIGALADLSFYEHIKALANQYQRAIHLPSGAIGGLDLLQNAHAQGEVSDVTLITRKSAHSLIDQTIERETVVFSGSAKDAIQQFPKNINVSIILSMAGVGLEKTNVKIIADPEMTKNRHEIKISGTFGEATFAVTNEPLVMNPKTSYLAALSVLGTLKRLPHTIKVG